MFEDRKLFRCLQLGDRSLQFPLGLFVGGQRLVLQGGEDVFPDQIQLRLHILIVCGHDDDGVVLRHHDAKLTVLAVAAIHTVSALPELIPVADQPV